MADSTVYSIKGDTSDLDAKLKGLKNSFEQTMSASEHATKRVQLAQNQLTVAYAVYSQRVKSTEAEIAKLNAEKEKNGTLSKEQQLRLDALNAQLKTLGVQYAKQEKVLTKNVVQAKRLDASLRSSITTYRALIAATTSSSRATDKNTQSVKKENAERRALGTTLVRHIRRLESLAVAYFAVTSAYKSTLGAGVQLNREYENMELGISAIIAAKTKAIDVTGKEVDATTKFIVSQQQTKAVLQDIKMAATETPATFSQMVGFYQQAIGHALAAGDAFGASLQEINQNTITLTKRMSSLGASVGMSMDLIDEEIRSLMSGDVSRDSKLALILFGSPTKANAAIKEAKKSVNGLRDLFNEKLIPFAMLENIDTFDKNLNKLIAEVQTLQKAASEPIFDDMSESFKELTIYLRANQDLLSGSFKVFYSYAKTMLSHADSLAKIYVAYKAGGLIATGILTAIDLMKKLNSIKKSAIALTKVELALETALNAVKTKGLGLAVSAGAMYASYELLNKFLENVSENANSAYDELRRFEELVASGQIKTEKRQPFDIIEDYNLVSTNHLIQAHFEATEMLKMHQKNLVDATKKHDKEAMKNALEGVSFYQAEIAKFSVAIPNYIRLVQDMVKVDTMSASEKKKQADLLLELRERSELLGVDDNSKEKKKLYQKYLKDLEKFKDFSEAKLILTKEYNEKYDTLDEKQMDEKERKRNKILDDATKQSQKEFEAEQKIRKLSIDLLDNEQDKKIAMANWSHDNLMQELEVKQKLGKISDEQYKVLVEKNSAIHKKVVEGYSDTAVIMRNMKNELEDGFTDFFNLTSDGFLDMQNLASNVLNQIMMDMIKMKIAAPLAGGISSGISALFMAQGGSFSGSPSLSAHSNSIVSQPTPFFFANGGVPNLGIMGEAGSEAIMPLTRTSDGDLGVRSVGGSGNVMINIENNTSTPIEAEMISELMKTDERGEEQKVINIVLKNIKTNSTFRNALRS